MSLADEYLQPEDTPPSHPRLRRWAEALARANASGFVEVHQPRSLLGPEAATLYVTIEWPGGSMQDGEPWSAELHRGLVSLRVKGRTEEDEARRFALALRDGFEPIQTETGEGYFNAVLVYHLRRSTIAGDLASVLDKIHAYKPSDGRLAECDQWVRDVIRDQGHDLIALGWAPYEAARILIAALRQYLDDRFYVTTREAMGF